MRVLIALAAVALAAQKSPTDTVLKLLSDTREKIKAENAASSKDHEEFLEWSRSTIQDSEHSIERNNDKIAEFEAILQKATAQIAAMESSIADLSSRTAQDQQDLDAATSLRKRQSEDYLNGQQELEDTIGSLVRAVGVLRKAGLGGGPAEQAALTQVTEVLSTVMEAATINSDDKQRLQSLLQADDDGFEQPEAKAYVSHSGKIIDVIEDLRVKAEGELSELRKDEMTRQHEFDVLRQGLADAIKVQSRDHKADSASLAENSEIKAKAEGDLAAEKSDLAANTQYLADNEAQRKQKIEDFAATTKSSSEELAALAKATEILEKTFADSAAASGAAKAVRASFMQVTSPEEDLRSKVVSQLRAAARSQHSLALEQLAVRAGGDTFGKVKGLIRDMLARLQKKAAAEMEKNAYCNQQKDENTAKRDDQEGKLNGFSARLESGNADLAGLKADVATLSEQVANLGDSMATMTALREKEATAYAHDAEAYKVMLSGLQAAIQTLREYYSTSGAADHSKKSDSAGGIVAMLETFEQDSANAEAEAELAEANAIKAFKKFMQDSKMDDAAKQAGIKSKQGELARLSQLLRDLSNDVDGAQAELDATLQYLAKLKEDCTHKPQSFEERAAAMQAEIASLKQALTILSEETSAFLQRQ